MNPETNDDRIKLAEAIGWKWRQDKKLRPPFGYWYDPDGSIVGCLPGDWNGNDSRTKADVPFDPFTDTNDCEAVKEWLNRNGYELDILHWKEGDATLLLKRDFKLRHETTVNDWKQGVCELALEVIE